MTNSKTVSASLAGHQVAQLRRGQMAQIAVGILGPQEPNEPLADYLEEVFVLLANPNLKELETWIKGGNRTPKP